MTYGKRFLIEWIKEDTMTPLNNSQATWVDSSKNNQFLI